MDDNVFGNPNAPLCDELKKYLVDMGDFYAVQHPLVYSVPHHSELNDLCNRQLAARAKFVESAETRGDWIAAIGMVEKPHRIDYTLRNGHGMDEDSYWECAKYAWTSSENTFQYEHDVLQFLFSRLGRDKPPIFKLFGKQDKEAFDLFKPELTVYRGCGSQNPEGWSWTLNKNQAIKLACRYHGTKYGNRQPILLQGRVKKADVIAYFHLDARGESEIVVSPKKVFNITNRAASPAEILD